MERAQRGGRTSGPRRRRGRSCGQRRREDLWSKAAALWSKAAALKEAKLSLWSPLPLWSATTLVKAALKTAALGPLVQGGGALRYPSKAEWGGRSREAERRGGDLSSKATALHSIPKQLVAHQGRQG